MSKNTHILTNTMRMSTAGLHNNIRMKRVYVIYYSTHSMMSYRNERPIEHAVLYVYKRIANKNQCLLYMPGMKPNSIVKLTREQAVRVLREWRRMCREDKRVRT